MLTSAGAEHPDIPLSEINIIYNACDVGLHTSMGETWGVAAFEHAATGAPQILPAHDVLREPWPRGAMLVDCDGRQPMGSFLDGMPPNLDGVVNALERLYSDYDLRTTLGNQAKGNFLDVHAMSMEAGVLWDSLQPHVL
jgi:glycosyltransferase involved in cell wall biosynthesis